jgi:hypothetical protein
VTNIVPFRRISSAPGPRGRALGREAWQCLPAASLTGDYEPRTPALDHHSLSLGQGPLKGHPLPSQAEILRQTHQHLADCWAIRAESRRIRRRYEERQRAIDRLLAGLGWI